MWLVSAGHMDSHKHSHTNRQAQVLPSHKASQVRRHTPSHRNAHQAIRQHAHMASHMHSQMNRPGGVPKGEPPFSWQGIEGGLYTQEG